MQKTNTENEKYLTNGMASTKEESSENEIGLRRLKGVGWASYIKQRGKRKITLILILITIIVMSVTFRLNAILNPPTKSDSNSMAGSSSSSAPKWAQKTLTLPPLRRGCHLITSKIVKEIGQDLSSFNCGLAHLFLQHTSASLTINENYDSDVRDDTETFLNRIVPEGSSAPWKHTLEGPDDMPAHIKSSIFGNTLTIPITDGKLNMGTWQGIWLCEHRDYPTARKVVITLNGI